MPPPLPPHQDISHGNTVSWQQGASRAASTAGQYIEVSEVGGVLVLVSDSVIG